MGDRRVTGLSEADNADAAQVSESIGSVFNSIQQWGR